MLMLGVLATAGCTVAYMEQRFRDIKTGPSDFDGTWDMAGVDL
jgi:hypothetical protein